ncbi:MAG: phenylalanine--tRNA ligase subunit beta [Patescibacteria group bacterium]
MLIPIKWLKQFTETEKSDQEIADILLFSGTNIESVENGVIDAEITANRPDCLSIYGTAREYAAMSKEELLPLEISQIDISTFCHSRESGNPVENGFHSLASDTADNIEIQIESSDICPRYCGYAIKNIQIMESPDWMKERLQAAGMRPINNIVDITNYIMLETGQPLHAFDFDKIKNSPMLVRKAKDGEMVKTLDQIERKLDNDAIVIENNGKIVDLTGIMGGAESEIDLNTKNIFLQAAIFNPVMIRRTSKRTKLSTEASYRYERGVDMEKALDYLKRAANLFKDLANGEIIQEIDIYKEPLKPFEITWSLSKAESLLGVELKAEEVINNLKRLQIETSKTGDDTFVSKAPSHRMDLCLPEDIYEEIIRFYPVNDLVKTTLKPIENKEEKSFFSFKEYVKDILAELGLTEIYGYSFLSKKDLDSTSQTGIVKIDNPMSEEHEYLRPSLLFDMLTAVFRNPSFDPIAIFEVGHVFTSEDEKEKLGIMIAGRGSDHLESVTDQLLKNIEAEAEIKVIDIDENILNKLKIRKKNVRYLEIDLEELYNSTKLTTFNYKVKDMDQKYTEIAKFPSVNRDIAIIVDDSIDPSLISTKIKQTDNMVKSVELFDQYISDKFGIGKKSLAYHILYQSDEKTLNDVEVTKIHNQIVVNLENEFNAKLRD